jgi:hypothetical protein
MNPGSWEEYRKETVAGQLGQAGGFKEFPSMASYLAMRKAKFSQLRTNIPIRIQISLMSHPALQVNILASTPLLQLLTAALDIQWIARHHLQG